jgi:hypothetical protein
MIKSDLYYHYQYTSESKWIECLGSELIELMSGDNRPSFHTVLGRNEPMDRTKRDKVQKYQGPLYFDIDCEGDIPKAIQSTVTLIKRLINLDVSVNSIKLFASGSKGFHVEVPQEAFIENIEPIEGLPQIYRIMASNLAVAGMDSTVYSSRSGRQWRCENVQRSNGKFKVSLTFDELLTLDENKYIELVSKPRPSIEVTPSKLADGLALRFLDACDEPAIKNKVWRKTVSETKHAPRMLNVGITAPIEKGGRNAEVHRLASALRAGGGSYHDILMTLTKFNIERVKPPLDINELETIIESACEYKPESRIQDSESWTAEIESADNEKALLDVAKEMNKDASLSETEKAKLTKVVAKKAGVSLAVLRKDLKTDRNTAALTGEILPLIRIVPGQFSQSVDRCVDVLPCIPSLYIRDSQLLEVVSAENDGMKMHVVEAPRLMYLLSKHANFQRGDVEADPPLDVVQSVLCGGSRAGLRPLDGVLNQPLLDSSGDITPVGYSAELRRLVAYNPQSFPEYQGTAKDALLELTELLSGFPFESPVDFSAAIAAVLSAVIRPALETCPAYLVTAHDLGSGKTTLARLIALFAGQHVSLDWKKDSASQSKVIYTALLEGHSCILFDNLIDNWMNATLAVVLTDSVFADRLFMKHQSVSVSTKALILATGNNVKAVKDLTRRVVPINLDTQGVNPAGKAKFDPEARVKENQGYWIMLALKILQDFIKAGKPKVDLPVIGSYPQWSNTVRQCMPWLGLVDAGQNLVDAVGEDPDLQLLEVLLVNWFEILKDKPVTTAQLLEQIGWATDGAQKHLRDVMVEIAGVRGEVDRKVLGQWLAGQVKRLAGGYRLESAGRGRAGMQWLVRSPDDIKSLNSVKGKVKGKTTMTKVSGGLKNAA